MVCECGGEEQDDEGQGDGEDGYEDGLGARLLDAAACETHVEECGDTSQLIFFICFVKLKEGLETQTREFSIRRHGEAPVDVVLGRSAVFLGRLVLHRLVLVFHEMCKRFAVQWRGLFALFFVVLQRLPQSRVEGRADRGHRGHRGHLGDRGDGGLLGLCALRLTLLEHSGEFRGIHVYVWIVIVFYMQGVEMTLEM